MSDRHSTCDDWLDGGYYGECPCLQNDHEGEPLGCRLKLWHHGWGFYGSPIDYDKDAVVEAPDTCPYAPILKLLAEAKEVEDVGVGPPAYHHDDKSAWQEVTFWIRR